MKFLTFTNYGCTEMCKNLLASARLAGIHDDDFIVACIDGMAFDEMSRFHSNVDLFIDQPLTEYHNYSQDIGSKFRDIVSIKLDIINKYYNKNQEICYVDSDIVFRLDPRKYFKPSKVLLQDEFPNNTACTGFMVFNNDICSKEFLGLIVNNILLFKSHTGTDQELINYLISSNMIPSSHYEYLDKNLFLNGMCFYDSRSIQDSVIVHGNCIIGINNKINRFKKYGLWYI